MSGKGKETNGDLQGTVLLHQSSTGSLVKEKPNKRDLSPRPSISWKGKTNTPYEFNTWANCPAEPSFEACFFSPDCKSR